MMDLYNQFKANAQKNNMQNQNDHTASSSMPTTNAQYRYDSQVTEICMLILYIEGYRVTMVMIF
jgi:hypothetical protein